MDTNQNNIATAIVSQPDENVNANNVNANAEKSITEKAIEKKDCKIVGDTPQTVKHGHGRWEYDENAVDFNIGGWRCSECGVRNNNLPTDRLNPYLFQGSSYCPQCGAKMDLKSLKSGKAEI